MGPVVMQSMPSITALSTPERYQTAAEAHSCRQQDPTGSTPQPWKQVLDLIFSHFQLPCCSPGIIPSLFSYLIGVHRPVSQLARGDRTSWRKGR